MNFLQQQARFDDFMAEFNADRPQEAFDMKCPVEVYAPSSKPYSGLPDLTYPLHDRGAAVTHCGRIRICRKRINISTVLAGQPMSRVRFVTYVSGSDKEGLVGLSGPRKRGQSRKT